ncbi:MAG: PD-(D/E)XK nuclease family protein [Candidatus Desulfofervidus auxilii]|nr:PD-(D/E)XK nuclease family protein [Candidatus Desulfofervidus auxilii]
MSSSVFVVSFKTDILKTVGKHLLENWTSLENIALIFPTKRNKFYFQQYLQELTGKEAFHLPYLYEVSEFINEATLVPYEGILLNRWQRNLLLKEAILKTKQDLSPLFGKQLENLKEDFFGFLSVGDRLLRFYEEIFREKVSFSDLKKEALYTDYETHINILENIWLTYEKLLKDNRLIDPLLKEIALLLDEEFLKSFKAIYLVGPVIMTRIETEFFKHLSKIVPLIIFFQTEDRLFSHQETILKRLEVQNDDICWLKGNDFLFPTPPVIKAFPNATSQIGFILKSIEESFSFTKPHKIAIVLPDDAFKYVLLSYIHEKNLNLTMGLDVKHTLTYRFLHQFYELFKSETEYGYYYRPFLQLLTHPFLKQFLRKECNKWQEKVFSENLIYIKDNKKDALFAFLEEIKYSLRAEDLIKFSKKLIDLLEKWQKEESLKSFFSHHYEIIGVNKILEALLEITTLENLSLNLGKAEFLKCFQFLLEHLSSLTYPLPGGIMGKVQVMEMLETRNLRFDVVIMPDMNEGIFPVSSEKDMFLNTAIRQKVGLPTYKEREKLYRYYFMRLLKGAKRCYFSYVDSPQRGIRSRFLEELLFQQWQKDKEIEKSVKNYAYYIVSSPKTSILQSSFLKKDISNKLNKFKFSPSALLCYQVCPYKFYLRYILEIEPLPKVMERITAKDKGLVFHKALKELYKEKIWEKGEEIFLQKLKEKLLYHFNNLPQVKHQLAARLEVEAILERLWGFVKEEFETFKNGWRPDTKLIEKEIEITLEFCDLKVCLKGIPDRVDRRENEFRIIDYKTGNMFSKKECEISENFRGIQLPFYLFILHKKYGLSYEDCENLCFYDLKNFRLEQKVYQKFLFNRNAYMKQFEEWLKERIREIFNPENPWSKQIGKDCNYCDYKDICEWE